MMVCLDLEGVLIPEIWVEVAKRFKVEALKRTTREEPDYDRLMKYRIATLKSEKIKLKDIQKVIAKMTPLPGAKAFLDKLRKTHQVVILSDTFYEFAMPLISQLGYPSIWCHSLKTDSDGYISGYQLRQKDSKKKAVQALKSLGFEVRSAGDSYNDLSMLCESDKGVLFNPPANIIRDNAHLPVATSYKQLYDALRCFR